MRDDELFEAFSDIDRYYLNEGVPYIKDRRRLSKTGLIVSLVAIIILAMGSFWYFRIHSCGFHLRYQQGEYYLERNARYNFDNYIGDPTLHHFIDFKSVSEMRNDFLTYNFTDNEILSINHLLNGNKGRINLPNLQNLYEPICPNDVIYQGKITWNGSEEYRFQVTSTFVEKISFVVTSRKTYEASRSRLMDYTADTHIDIIEKKQIEDRNATLYVKRSKRNGEVFCMVVYMLTKGDKTIYVEEEYGELNPDELTPNTIPSYINLYIQDGNAFASAYLQSFDYRPPAEWLFLFGLKKVQ